MTNLSLLYLPSAFIIGGLHGLEPGHAKTLTAAYLIGTRGTKRDALLLGLSVALTHSAVVVGLVVGALYLGREAFTDQATHYLQIGSGIAVIALGSWMLWRGRPARFRKRQHTHDHTGEDGHDHHDHSDEDAHARAHAASMPDYVREGQRPTALQIMFFGAAGGMIPCPASITVMLLSVSANQTALGLLTVLGFSAGLAVTLVGIGLLVVAGLSKLAGTGRLGWISRNAPSISASVVILSGVVALTLAH
jgi:nickel/cobalt transporter (NicO) family protein